MNDAFGVRGVQGVGDFNRQREKDFGIDGLPVDAMLQRHAVQKFHGNERLPVLLTNIVNRADVGMIQRRCGLRFALETDECLRVSGNLLGQKLQRNKAMQAGVFGLVNNAHPAAAEFFEDAVV